MSNETQSLLLCIKERRWRRRIERWREGMEKEEEEIRWRRGSSYRSLGSSGIIAREGPDMLRSSNKTLKLSPDKF